MATRRHDRSRIFIFYLIIPFPFYVLIMSSGAYIYSLHTKNNAFMTLRGPSIKENAITFLTLSQTSPGFYASAVQLFGKHCEKRRNCSQRAISPFPTVFSTRFRSFLPLSSDLKLSSANSFSLEESKVCRLG